MDALTYRAMHGLDPLGERQFDVLFRALRSPSGMVMPSGFLERRACKRLTARCILVPALGLPDVWILKSKAS